MLFLKREPNWRNFNNWSPFEELNRMRRDMERLTEGFSKGSGAGVFPLMNVTEDNDAYYIRAELPGLKSDEIELSVTGDSISISGERKIANEEGAKYHRRERESGKFNRIFNLPGPVDVEKVDASSVDGVLVVKLPKSEVAKPRQITIK